METVLSVCVYMLVHGCVCASHADEMKNGGRLKYMCQQNAIRKDYMCSSLAALHVSLTRPRLSHSLADTPCTIYNDSDV